MASLMSRRREAAWGLGPLLSKVYFRERKYVIFFALTNGSREAVHALGDVAHIGTGKAIHKVMGESNNLEPLEASAGDRSLGEERTMESRDHEKVHGFPSSIVPTMEEKVVMESIPEDSVSSKESKGQKGDHDKTLKLQNGDARESQAHGGSAESRNQDVKTNGDVQILEAKRDRSEVKTTRSAKSFRDPSTSSTNLGARLEDGELYGAPADASRDSKTDDQPPHAVSGKNDATETEERAVHARAEIRKHISTKFNPKVWTLPTPTPKVDPHGFEDPISDEFWNKVWMACAVHNVGESSLSLLSEIAETPPTPLDRDLSQGVPRCSRRSRHYLETVQGFHPPPRTSEQAGKSTPFARFRCIHLLAL